MLIFVFTDRTTQSGCDTRSIFKRRFEFRCFILLIICHTEVKEPILPYYLP